MMSEMGGKEFETHIEKYVQDNTNGKITGTDFPITNTATPIEIMQAGVVTEVGGIGKHYYFTCAGLAWYLKNKK